MKHAALALIMVLSSSIAFARQPKATQFGEIAEKVATAMYSAEGDTVQVELVDMLNTDEYSKEVWQVTFTNGPQQGSAAYEVTIKQKTGGSNDGEEVATIHVKFLSGT
jgi:hypothetical protein